MRRASLLAVAARLLATAGMPKPRTIESGTKYIPIAFIILASSADAMRVERARHRRWDYATLFAVAAIVLSVAVILGIIYNYANARGPINDLATRMTTPQQQPSDLQRHAY